MTQRKSGALFISVITVAREAFRTFIKNDPLRLAGATAFFTSFALPPILVILIQTLGLVFDHNSIRQKLFSNLSLYVGNESVDQIINILIAFRKLDLNGWMAGAGFIFLLFVATTLFKVINSSLNQLWSIRITEKKFSSSFRERFRAMVVIIMAAFLFGLGIFIQTTQALLGKYIFDFSPFLSLMFLTVLNYLFSLIIVTAWFTIMFRYLPDGRPVWSVALMGGLITGLLFSAGKVILHWLLGFSNITTIYGASGSVVLLLLFVFYSSFILYYGACFTKIWADHIQKPIRLLPNAKTYHMIIEED